MKLILKVMMEFFGEQSNIADDKEETMRRQNNVQRGLFLTSPLAISYSAYYVVKGEAMFVCV